MMDGIDQNHLRSLRSLKIRLQRLVIVVAVLDLTLIVVTAISIFLTNSSFTTFLLPQDTRQWTFRSIAAIDILSMSLFVIIMWALFAYERDIRSSQILSALVADEMGWYSEYSSSKTKKPVRRKAIRSTVRSTVTSDEAVGAQSNEEYEYDALEYKRVLREIAENTHFPFVESEYGSTIYAGIAMLSFFTQMLITYWIFRI
jgi:hypothetical protein